VNNDSEGVDVALLGSLGRSVVLHSQQFGGGPQELCRKKKYFVLFNHYQKFGNVFLRVLKRYSLQKKYILYTFKSSILQKK